MDDKYYLKYLKYRNKYLALKGGGGDDEEKTEQEKCDDLLKKRIKTINLELQYLFYIVSITNERKLYLRFTSINGNYEGEFNFEKFKNTYSNLRKLIITNNNTKSDDFKAIKKKEYKSDYDLDLPESLEELKIFNMMSVDVKFINIENLKKLKKFSCSPQILKDDKEYPEKCNIIKLPDSIVALDLNYCNLNDNTNIESNNRLKFLSYLNSNGLNSWKQRIYDFDYLICGSSKITYFQMNAKTIKNCYMIIDEKDDSDKNKDKGFDTVLEKIQNSVNAIPDILYISNLNPSFINKENPDTYTTNPPIKKNSKDENSSAYDFSLVFDLSIYTVNNNYVYKYIFDKNTKKYNVDKTFDTSKEDEIKKFIIDNYEIKN